MKSEKNLKWIPGKNGDRGYYNTEITLNGKRVRRNAGYTKEEAKIFLGELRKAKREGNLDEILNPKKSMKKFGEYARNLFDSPKWQEKRSTRRDEISLTHLNRKFRNMDLDEIKPDAVRSYRTNRKKEVKPSTINREISLLKSILNRAVYEGVIVSNPIDGKKIEKLEEPEGREKDLLKMGIVDDYEKQRAIIENARSEFKPIFEVALTTGMRLSEILKMKWTDLNVKPGFIYIPKENAKGKKERYIPLMDLINTLRSIERKGEYVFINPSTKTRWYDLRKPFKSAVEKSGMVYGREEGGIVFHDLRHLALYRMAKRTDIITVSKIAGHSSIEITKRYIHPTDQDKRDAISGSYDLLFSTRQKHVNDQIEIIEEHPIHSLQVN